MSREAFEKAFPKPLAIYWDKELQQYEPIDDGNSRAEAAAEEYHAAYVAWKVAWEAQQARIDDLHTQLEQAQSDRKHYGAHLAAALKGDKLPSEPVDQRLDKVREIVAKEAELEKFIDKASKIDLESFTDCATIKFEAHALIGERS